MNLFIIDDKDLNTTLYGENQNITVNYNDLITMLNVRMKKNNIKVDKVIIVHGGLDNFEIGDQFSCIVEHKGFDFDGKTKSKQDIKSLENDIIDYIENIVDWNADNLILVDALLTNNKEDEYARLALELSKNIVKRLIDINLHVAYYSTRRNDPKITNALAEQNKINSDLLKVVSVSFSYPDSIAFNLEPFILKLCDKN